MKHYYLVTLYGYDEEGKLFYATGFAECDRQSITKADVLAISEKAEKDSEFPLGLHGISYMGCMTQDAFKHLRSMSGD